MAIPKRASRIDPKPIPLPPPGPERDALVARFHSKIDRSAGPDECWPWTAGRFAAGYGMFTLCHGRPIKAHRFALLVAGTDLPPRLCVRHRCHNRPCCNPAHLVLGSFRDNSADAVAARRTARGEANGGAKLDEYRVRAIRCAATARLGTQPEIARAMGVSTALVSAIVRGLVWRDVANPYPVDPRGAMKRRTRAKLSQNDVATIRDAVATTDTRNSEIAAHFGLSTGVVGKIARGITWQEVEGRA